MSYFLPMKCRQPLRCVWRPYQVLYPAAFILLLTPLSATAAPSAAADAPIDAPLVSTAEQATAADDFPVIIDLTFPDLQASLPPLELIDPVTEPTTPVGDNHSTRAERGVFGRIRQWFNGGDNPQDTLLAEPVIGVEVRLVDQLPRVEIDSSLQQWIDDPALVQVEPLALPTPLPPLLPAQRDAALLLLQDNLNASLARVTVAEFAEFSDSLPRLRSLAREAAQAVGFYESQFFFRKTGADQLQVEVVAGAPVRVSTQQIKIEGQAQEQRRFQRIESQPDLAIGDVLNHAKYEQTKNRIASAARERGYFDGQWQANEVLVTLPDQVADVQLIYQSGERYRFGEVDFRTAVDGMPLPVRRELLEALLPFQSGDRYDGRDVQTLSRQLLDVRWFNNIEVTAFTPDAIRNQQMAGDSTTVSVNPPTETLPTEAMPATTPTENAQSILVGSAVSDRALSAASDAKIVPIRVLVDARQPNSAEVGVGYGTDTGIRLRSQYRRALVNDRGHSFDADLELSQIRQALDTRYSLPYRHPLRDTLSVFGGFEREEVAQLDDNFSTQTFGGTIGVERSIRPSPDDWQRTLSLRYRIDRVDVQFNDLAAARAVDASTDSTSLGLTQQALLAGYALSKRVSLGGVDPYQGLRQLYQIELGSQALLSDVDLAILRAGWQAIHSFTEARTHQLVGRLDLATILTDDFDRVPFILRFFAGGDQSIRGYDYKSLANGQNLAVGSLEYNYRFLPSWRGAVFVDAGNAFDEKFADDIKVGAGVGVRWSSPIGPIRIDVAAGLSEPSVPIRLHFFIGPSL